MILCNLRTRFRPSTDEVMWAQPAALTALQGSALSGKHLLDILRDATPVCGIPSFPVSTFVPANAAAGQL